MSPCTKFPPQAKAINGHNIPWKIEGLLGSSLTSGFIQRWGLMFIFTMHKKSKGGELIYRGDQPLSWRLVQITCSTFQAFAPIDPLSTTAKCHSVCHLVPPFCQIWMICSLFSLFTMRRTINTETQLSKPLSTKVWNLSVSETDWTSILATNATTDRW